MSINRSKHGLSRISSNSCKAPLGDASFEDPWNRTIDAPLVLSTLVLHFGRFNRRPKQEERGKEVERETRPLGPSDVQTRTSCMLILATRMYVPSWAHYPPCLGVSPCLVYPPSPNSISCHVLLNQTDRQRRQNTLEWLDTLMSPNTRKKYYYPLPPPLNAHRSNCRRKTRWFEWPLCDHRPRWTG